MSVFLLTHAWLCHSHPSLRYTALFNALELPVTQVPMGLTPEGLPIGVQIVGAHGCDHVTIRAAQELARRLGVDHGLPEPPTAQVAAAFAQREPHRPVLA